MLFLCFCFRNGKSLTETETAEKCQKTAESLFFVLEPYGIIKTYKEKGRFYEMITRLEEISVTKESYPFASAERYLQKPCLPVIPFAHSCKECHRGQNRYGEGKRNTEKNHKFACAVNFS